MKNKKLILIYILLITYILINYLISYTSFFNIFSNLVNPLLLLGMCFASWHIDKKKNRNRNKYSKLQDFIIIMIIYILVYYLLGLIFGFCKNIYSLSFRSFISNFISMYLVLFFQEYIRYKLLNSSHDKLNIFIITLFFIIININLFYLFNLKDSIDTFNYLFDQVIPIIIINITLSYLSRRIDYIPSFIYVGIIYGITFFSPILTDINPFIYILLLFILFIFISIFIDNLSILDIKRIRRKDRKKSNSSITYLLMTLVIILILFILGVFKYKPVVILSNSMEPLYSRGDVIIIKKISTKEFTSLKNNDIIYYSKDSNYITHRIYDIDHTLSGNVYITKGDNNDNIDAWEVRENDIHGKYIFRIKYVGWFSVCFSELFN